MLLMLMFKKISFFYPNSHPIQLIFDLLKGNVKPRLTRGHKAGKDIKNSSITN